MDEDRLAISDELWEQMWPCCRVKPVILEQLVTTIVSLWKRFSCHDSLWKRSETGLMLGYLRVFSMR